MALTLEKPAVTGFSCRRYVTTCQNCQPSFTGAVYVSAYPLQLPGGIEGGAEFQTAFQENERKSDEGRSLKDFRLYERLMKYRCSYLIYSEPFRHLPGEMKGRVLQRLHAILDGRDASGEFSHLGESERAHISDILTATLRGFPPEKDE